MPTRMSADARRELVLTAAVSAFAEGGYTGTTTDQVARRAGVSQPYVVRMFGTKQALFLAVHERVMARMRAAFAEAAASAPAETKARLGDAYVELIADDDLLRVMQHGFALGADPDLGPHMRASFLAVFRQIRELTGADPEQTRAFLAQGMLINTLALLQMPASPDPDAAVLMDCVLYPTGSSES